jgi:hypothetical protein
MPKTHHLSNIPAVWLALMVGLVIETSAPSSAADEPMIALTLRGARIEGLPLSWSEEVVHLLGRDGRLWQFPPQEAKNFKKMSTSFRCNSPSEIRAALLRELGNEYEVSGTTHYLVAHPAGQGDKWADRFEDLYRSFVHYFTLCGLRPAAPPFPLIAVVCRDQGEFMRRAAAQGGPVGTGVLGYYDILSNRVSVYDMGGKINGAHWQQNASVVIHEATHQTAFNTGVHSRYTLPPKWLSEGLAMLFEAPGVYDSRNHPNPSERVNWGRLRAFRDHLMSQHRSERFAAMVASDQLFASNPGAAYAEAWAVVFFLIETDSSKLSLYLHRTASRPPFEPYPAAERTADFTAVFGNDWRMLEARFLRFIEGVK